MEIIKIPYTQAKPLLKDGDVALFRGKTIFSWFLKKAGGSPYSHVGCIGRRGDYVELIELKEFIGGRIISFDRILSPYNGLIDIYRPAQSITVPKLVQVNDVWHQEIETFNFNGAIIAQCMRELAGAGYDWGSIAKLSRVHFLFIRWFFRNNKDILTDKPTFLYNKYFCSDSVSKCFRENYHDLVKNRSDKGTDPSDVARSTLLNYIFTPVLESKPL